MTEPPEIPKRRCSLKKRIFQGFIWSVAIVFGLAIILRLFGLLIPYRIPMSAMAPTLVPGDQLFMEGFSYRFSDPERGDVATFEHIPRDYNFPATDQIKQIYVKRVVGLPSEALCVKNGKIHADGRELEEFSHFEAVNSGWKGFLPQFPETYVVPDKSYFMMGDNHHNSADSRMWGPVSRDKITGRAFLRFWPFDRFGGIR